MKWYKSALFFAFLVILFSMNSCIVKHTFYIDSINGDDANSGNSRRNAWATVSKINETTFLPGDKILFCSGQIFNGTIKLKNLNGTSEQSILISTFGEGKATIFGGNSEAFVADSCSFLEIKNFDFVGSGRKNGNTTSGVIVSNSQNISVDSIKVSGFQKAGIKVANSQNIGITRVHAFENGFAGILTGDVYYNPFKLLSKNIYIGYCTTENNPGDPTILDNHSGSGILVSGTDSAIVEYCLAKNNGWDQPWEGNGPIGIWAYHSNHVIIQHCIAHSNKTNPKGWDGGGFDFDGGVTNSVMQYNLSYNNMGPGYGLYQYYGAKKWENNIVKYNISFNDGTEIDSCGLQIWNGQPDGPEMKNALIYNNVFYNDFGRAVNYKNGNVPGLYYWNNVFVSSQQPVAGEHSKSVFENNLYWRIENAEVDFVADSTGIFANPNLKLPDTIEFLTEVPSELKDLEFFKLLPGSTCIATGKRIPQNGGFDFWGTSIPDDS
ncbi:MAG: right-handed parallel beta-helix repeat-containing protein, partial [Bacteroidetes bacterium]